MDWNVLPSGQDAIKHRYNDALGQGNRKSSFLALEFL